MEPNAPFEHGQEEEGGARPRGGVLGLSRGSGILLFSVVMAALALVQAGSGFIPVPEIKIALGCALFFIIPGLLFTVIAFPDRSPGIPERLPLSIALTMGLFAFPGLAAYVFEWSLEKTVAIELSITGLLAVVASVRILVMRPSPGRIEEPGAGRLLVWLVGLVLAGLAAWTGAFRGVNLDWDYFNYISAVRKLLAWGGASTAHFAYADAPPDPVHSYNIWALQWALAAKTFELDPIVLYLRSAFITVPAAGLAFYALARRLFGPGMGLTSLFLYASYHVIYGGLLFVGRTTFYPADSQWLIVFPASLYLFAYIWEERRQGCFFDLFAVAGLALSVLAMSVVHVLWGLCFYLSLACLAAADHLRSRRAWSALYISWRSAHALSIVTALSVAALPLAAALAACISMAVRGETTGESPLFTYLPELPTWTYGLALIGLPLLYIFILVRPYLARGQNGPGAADFALLAAMLCLFVSIPYIALRWQAVQVTDWTRFGKNPYRAFVGASMFFLNPFQRSLDNPNVSFYPIYILSFMCLPLLRGYWKGKLGPALTASVMICVALICFHPVLATLFAKYFSLGYLRRLLRLMALMSLFPAAAAIHRVSGSLFPVHRMPSINTFARASAAVLISLACVQFPARPFYYNHMARKTYEITTAADKDSLLYDARPYELIAENDWFGRDEVIFSDIWTSYRLTAYLPQYVAARQKPGVGVPDQEERLRLEQEFFDPNTKIQRMRQILDRFNVRGVIVNRNLGYKLYEYPCGHPEAAGKIKRDHRHFEILYDKGDWLIAGYNRLN